MFVFCCVHMYLQKKKKISSVRIQPAGPGLGAGWMYWGHTKTFLDVSQAFFPNPLTTEVVPSAASQHNQHANMSPRVSVDFTSPCEETKTRSWKRSKATQPAWSWRLVPDDVLIPLHRGCLSCGEGPLSQWGQWWPVAFNWKLSDQLGIRRERIWLALGLLGWVWLH